MERITWWSREDAGRNASKRSMRPRNASRGSRPYGHMGKAALQRKSVTNALCDSTGVESDGMYRRNAHEARETEGDSGGNRNGQPARARSGRIGGGEARSSVETG